MSPGTDKQPDAAAEAIVDFIGSDWQPDEATAAAARVFILDSLGTGLSGSRIPWSQQLLALAHTWGGAGEVCVWGKTRTLSAPLAAMVNGYQIHNQEYDCVHEQAVVHPMAVILSSLMAFAEYRHISGQDFTRALCMAVDVATLLGVASQGGMGFFRPGICGAMGAAAGLACLGKLTPDQVRHTLGITYSQLSGTMQAHEEGSPVLPMQIGFNARNAVMAVQMAEAGLQGPRRFLQGSFGFYSLFEKAGNLAQVLTGLGAGEVKYISHKPFPTGRTAHGVLNALQRLEADNGLDIAKIDRIEVSAPPLILRLVDRPAFPDMSPAYARLCLGYVVAMFLVHKTVKVEHFDEDFIKKDRQRWQPLADKVHIQVNAVRDPNALVPQQVKVLMQDQSEMAIEMVSVTGSPECPLSEAQHLAKFQGCVQSASLNLNAERIVQLVADLDNLADMKTLADSLKPLQQG